MQGLLQRPGSGSHCRGSLETERGKERPREAPPWESPQERRRQRRARLHRRVLERAEDGPEPERRARSGYCVPHTHTWISAAPDLRTDPGAGKGPTWDDARQRLQRPAHINVRCSAPSRRLCCRTRRPMSMMPTWQHHPARAEVAHDHTFSCSAACGDDGPQVRVNAAETVSTRPVRLHLAFAPVVGARQPSAKRHGRPMHITMVRQRKQTSKHAREHGYVTWVAHDAVAPPHAVARLWRSPHQRRTVRAPSARQGAALAVRSHTNSRQLTHGVALISAQLLRGESV